MRKAFYFIAIIALVSLYSCNKEEEKNNVPDPEISLNSTDDIVVSYEGGTASIGYKILNPVESSQILAESSEDWISDFSYTDTEISFEVAPNEGTEERTATINLTYTYGEGLAVEATATVRQSFENAVPELKITETEVNVDADGGNAAIQFQIINPVPDGEISAEPSEDWISNFNYTDTEISFEVAPNENTEERSASISIVYTYGDGLTLEASATVNQSGMAPDPELELTTSEISAVSTGGEYKVSFTITNPANNGEISISTEAEDWISMVSYTDTDVTLNILENTEKAERNASVTLIYTYGNGKTLNAEFSVTQAPSEFDYVTIAEYMECYYYGAYGYNGEQNYYMTISDLGFDNGYPKPFAKYYQLDMYCGDPLDASNPLPIAGTYTLGGVYDTDLMTFSAGYSSAWGYGESTDNPIFSVTFAEGTIELSYADDGSMIMDIYITDEYGDKHHATYNGPCNIYAM